MKYPTTVKLLSLCIVVQVITMFCPNAIMNLAFSPQGMGSMLTLLTYQFTHASWQHLWGNFTFALPFLIYLEHKLGSDDCLLFYLLCGIGSALVFSYMHEGALVGSSGAIFGIAVGACLAFNATIERRLFGCLLISLLILPQLSYAMGGYGSVDYWGHVGGGLTALLLFPFFSKEPKCTSTRPPALPAKKS